MSRAQSDFMLALWAYDRNGRKVYPYKGERGLKKRLYSVNFTSDTKNFVGMSESELIAAVSKGRFRERGTIRMLPLNATS